MKMNNELKRKIESLSKEELIKLITNLCQDDEISKTVKMIIEPTERDVDRLLSSFGRWCNSFGNGSRTERTYNNLYSISSQLLKASEKIGTKKSAETAYAIYRECEELSEYDDDAIVDIMYNALGRLSDILKIRGNEFTAEEIRKYSCVIEDE